MKRLPRRVRLAGYGIDVALVSQAALRDLVEDDERTGVYEGLWVGEFEKWAPVGHIFIDQKLPLKLKWHVFWHELLHAVNDIRDWDANPDNRRSLE